MKRFNIFLAVAILALAALNVLHLTPAQGASEQGWQGFKAKTAAYTVLAEDCGVTFTNRGASGSVTFTLPAVAYGLHYRFVGIADQNIVVAADTADTLIVINDVAADSLAMSTSSQKIGGIIEVWCDGTSWIAVGITVGHTFTVATN